MNNHGNADKNWGNVQLVEFSGASEKPKVLLIATLDTKPTETAYLRDCLEGQGIQVIHLDPSIRRTVAGAEITPDMIAAAAGTNMQAVRDLRHEGKSQAVMMEGAQKLAHEIDAREGLSGILAIGGSMGTTLATSVMRSFPYGLPKVMISTMASGFTTPFVGTREIVMGNAVCDIAGLNTITRDVYRNGALAVAGMAKGYRRPEKSARPLVLMGTLGTTERCSVMVRSALEREGIEVMVFHTTGSGGQTLDQIVRERDVTAVIELSLVEMMDFLHGGLCSGGPDRARAELQKGVPTIFVPGNCDFVIAGPIEDAHARFPGKRYHIHNAALTAVRTEAVELGHLAKHLGELIGEAKGPVSIYVPLQGFSSHDSPEGHLHDLSMPPVFVKQITAAVAGRVPVHTLDVHVNTQAFADALVQQVLTYIHKEA